MKYKPLYRTPLDNFERKYTPEPMSGCWLWTAAMTTDGYGAFSFRGHKWRAHRAGWTLLRGEIPSGAILCHHCDNAYCVNPDHLYIGDHATNTADKVRRKRHSYNEGHGCAVLTKEKVREIRAAVTPLGLAAKYGVAHTTIYNVRRGRTWKCLP